MRLRKRMKALRKHLTKRRVAIGAAAIVGTAAIVYVATRKRTKNVLVPVAGGLKAGASGTGGSSGGSSSSSGASSPDRPPRAAVPLDYWGSPNEQVVEINTPAFASGPERSGGTACPGDHHCQRGPVPVAKKFAIPLSRPNADSEYRVQVSVTDLDAAQANTVIESQRWWIAGDSGEDLWGHQHGTPKRADSTCYGEDLQREFDVVGSNVVGGAYTGRQVFDCGETPTPAQIYWLERVVRKYRGTWRWQYEDWNKIRMGSPYANGRMYDLAIEASDSGVVRLVGRIAPTLPALSLQIAVRWWRRPKQ